MRGALAGLVALLGACGGTPGAVSAGASQNGGSSATSAGDVGGNASDGLCHPAGGAQYCLVAIKNSSGASLPAGVPVGMNDQGDLVFVEHSTLASGADHYTGYIWESGAVVMLPDNFAPTGINNHRAVSGMLGLSQAALWRGGSVTPLSAGTQANSINDDGVIAGQAFYSMGMNAQHMQDSAREAVVWVDPAAMPTVLGSVTRCDDATALALSPLGTSAGSWTGGDTVSHGFACGGQGRVETAAMWAGDGQRTDVETANPSYSDLRVVSIADDGKVLIVGGPGDHPHVPGIDSSDRALALGPAGHIYFDSRVIRLPDGTMQTLSDSTVDSPSGWDVASIDQSARAPPWLYRAIIGFDRLGRLYGVANFNGMPAPFVLTPVGQALP